VLGAASRVGSRLLDRITLSVETLSRYIKLLTVEFHIC
jgi:hypothetical protein